MNLFSKNAKIATFKSREKYFKFTNRDDITVLSVDYTAKGSIRVRYCKKVGRPKKKEN